MDLLERVRERARSLRGPRAQAAPSATLQVALRAGAWSNGGPAPRLARLCLAAASALRRDPLFAARWTAPRALSSPARPGLRVGPEGGRRWLRLGADELAQGPEALGGLLAGTPPAEEAGAGPGLEILDLSTLGAIEWRGALLGGAQGRLCLLAPRTWPSPEGALEVLGLALDFDATFCEVGRAARFLSALAAELGTELVGWKAPA